MGDRERWVVGGGGRCAVCQRVTSNRYRMLGWFGGISDSPRDMCLAPCKSSWIHELVRPLLRLLGEHLGALPALYVSSVGRF